MEPDEGGNSLLDKRSRSDLRSDLSAGRGAGRSAIPRTMSIDLPRFTGSLGEPNDIPVAAVGARNRGTIEMQPRVGGGIPRTKSIDLPRFGLEPRAQQPAELARERLASIPATEQFTWLPGARHNPVAVSAATAPGAPSQSGAKAPTAKASTAPDGGGSQSYKVPPVSRETRAPVHAASANPLPPPPPAPSDKLGVLKGVLIPTCENMWGVLIFLRFFTVVGTAGLGLALAIVTLSFLVALATTLSLSAIVTCGTSGANKVQGVYPLLARALGKEIATAIGVVYFVGIILGADVIAQRGRREWVHACVGASMSGSSCGRAAAETG
jgi:hypothetical protein